MSSAQPLLPAPIARSRLFVLISFYGLFAYFAVNTLLALGEFTAAAPVIWLIQVFPLLLFAYGIHKIQLRAYAWLSFVVLLYFMHGVLIAFDPQRLWLGVAEVALCTVLFVFLVIFIRQYRHHYQVGL